MNLQEFLQRSYTAYHAVAGAVAFLEKEGFRRLEFGDAWSLEVGGKYYVVKNGTSVFAFRVGKNFAFNIAESHTDSPSLKVKGNSLVDSPEGKRINVEKYGGPILYSFTDAPLAVAGRIIVEKDGKLVEKLVRSDYDVTIPSLAIHHNPTVNEGFCFNAQNDVLPLLGDADDLYSTLADEKIVDSDLYVVPATEPFSSGAKGEFFSSPRIDNLTSVFSSLKAIADCDPYNVAIVACFDNEEVGSQTKQGANSVLPLTLLRKIAGGLSKTEDEFVKACEDGFILSIDNAHAVHPAHPEKFDPKEKVALNGGVVVKHHVNYSTDGLSAAIVKTILDRAGVKRQDYFNRSDLRCGGTIGLMTSAGLSMNACDVGLAQLAMHSAVETVGKEDLERMDVFVKAFLNSSFDRRGSVVEVATK